jgi:hypothetical protein
MRNVDVILEALYVLDILFQEFENNVGLVPGTLLKLQEHKAEDFTNEELETIAKVYGGKLKDVGYHILSNTLFNDILITKDAIRIIETKFHYKKTWL